MRLRFIALAAASVWAAASNAGVAQDGRAVVSAAVRAMGAGNLKTLVLSGSGSLAGIGQNVTPESPWPLARLKTYTRAIDVDALTSRFDAVRVQSNVESPVSQVIAAKAPWARQFDLWVSTPFAFLKGAMANPVTLRSEVVNDRRYSVVGFTVDGKYTVEGYISDANIVERVRTRVDNDVLGDMLVEGVFSDYRDFGGVKVPALTIVKQGGFPTLIAGVKGAEGNVPVTGPAAPAAAAPVPAAPATTVDAEKIAEGVYALKGGTHHSVLVEFSDHVTLIEGPQNDARALALIQAIKKLYPAKTLTQVVNTHAHFDHAGGLRTFVDAGATILTHESNKPFFERTFKAPRTLSPDGLERSKRAATVTGVGDKLVLTDTTRTLELHHVRSNPHHEGMLIAFLPREKILVEGDMYTPPAPDAPRPAADAPVNPNAMALLENLERLRVDVDAILPLHGSVKATRADLYAYVKKSLVPVSSLPDPAAAAEGGRGGRGGGRGGAAAPAPQGAPPAPQGPLPAPGRGGAPQP